MVITVLNFKATSGPHLYDNVKERAKKQLLLDNILTTAMQLLKNSNSSQIMHLSQSYMEKIRAKRCLILIVS